MTTEPKPKPVYLDNAGYPEPKQGIENTECPSGCFFADFYHVVHVPSCSLFQHRSGEPIDEVMHRISHAEDDMQCHGYLDPVRKEIVALRAEVERLYGKVQGHGLVLAERDAREKAEKVIADLVEHHPKRSGWAEPPGHSHRIPGIWDDDNGDKNGTKCMWCATWHEARAILANRAKGEGR